MFTLSIQALLGNLLGDCRYGKESPGPSAYNLSGGMGRQVLSDHESLPAWQMGTDKRFQYDFIKRTQGMPGPGQPKCPIWLV